MFTPTYFECQKKTILKDDFNIHFCYSALFTARCEVDNINGKIAKLKLEASKSNEKFGNLVQTAASKKTELNGVEIRSKVINETLKQAESELNAALEELVSFITINGHY